MKISGQEMKWYEFASLMIFGNLVSICSLALTAYFAHINYPWYWPLILAALTGVMPKTQNTKEDE